MAGYKSLRVFPRFPDNCLCGGSCAHLGLESYYYGSDVERMSGLIGILMASYRPDPHQEYYDCSVESLRVGDVQHHR